LVKRFRNGPQAGPQSQVRRAAPVHLLLKLTAPARPLALGPFCSAGFQFQQGAPLKKTRFCPEQKKCSFCIAARERFPGLAHIHAGRQPGIKTVVGRQYLKRQATTLLKFAQTTSDPQVAAALVEKAADLKAQVERVPDRSPRAPDVELPTP
jgi:hypothetical protein